MSDNLPMFVWTEINDNEGETWHTAIIPITKHDYELFNNLSAELEELNEKFNNDTFSLEYFTGNSNDLKTLIEYSDDDWYYPEWSSLNAHFVFKFKLLEIITSYLLSNDNDKLNLDKLRGHILNAPTDVKDDVETKNNILSEINDSFGKTKYTDEAGFLYGDLISRLAYKMQIFD